MKAKREGPRAGACLLLALGAVCVLLLCICVGSISVPLRETLAALWAAFSRGEPPAANTYAIIVTVRLPRVLCAALSGAALSLCGAAMQGLLRNPLADGSTLGVSSGASLGAVLAIALGFTLPGFAGGGTMLAAMVFAFLSLLLILALAHRLDPSLETNTIILVGVIFSMFAGSLISLLVAFAGERLRPIMFWTMGSLSGAGYPQAAALLAALVPCAIVLLCHTRELNAFAMGELGAAHLGIPVRRVKLLVLAAVSVLIGVCVSVGGTIGFVGLVIPHMARFVVGPNHRRLLPASLFGGAIFLMLADLAARTVLRPAELPIGVVTSLVGAVVFIFIFYGTRRVKA